MESPGSPTYFKTYRARGIIGNSRSMDIVPIKIHHKHHGNHGEHWQTRGTSHGNH
jgi:hypothetical protein